MRPRGSAIGAGILIGLAAVYAVASVATGREARAERPLEIRADEAGLDAWKAALLLVREPGRVAIVDVRSAERFGQYHLPGSVTMPGASAQELTAIAAGKAGMLIVAEADKDASVLTAAVASAVKPTPVHFLKDGVRAWYLAFELPVPLFSDKPAPHGYESSIQTVRACLSGACPKPDDATEAIGLLSRSPYEPSMLQGRKPAPSGGAKKKISGGCGG